MAYSAMPEAMLPISLKGVRFNDALATHSFEGNFDNPKERARLMDDMDNLDAALLENHGYLVCGATVPECWKILYGLEHATDAHLAALSMGAAITVSPPAVVAWEKARIAAEHAATRAESWASQLHLLNRLDPSYRE